MQLQTKSWLRLWFYSRRPHNCFAQICYRFWSRDTRCTTDVQGQMLKVKVTLWKRSSPNYCYPFGNRGCWN